MTKQNMDKIFTDKFLELNKEKIIAELNKNGFFNITKAINLEFISKLESDFNENKFQINRNWITGVHADKQYFLTHLLACSQNFYNLVTSNNILSLSEKFLGNNFRLKALRYYETYGYHKMLWHTDNKTSDGFKKIPGLIFIIYMGDVNDGEFQYIKNSHTFSQKNNFNDYSNDFISKNYKDAIISFKGSAGDLIIYNSYGIHRAKPVDLKNFIRKSIFFQIDSEMNSGEPLLINPSYVKNAEKKILSFLGFGQISKTKIYPNTNIDRLPNKILFGTHIYNYIKKKVFIRIKKIFNN